MDSNIIVSSFYITYIFLITTGTVTFIESLRTPSPVVRHVMNLETCISIIAAYFYSIFLQKISDSKGKELPYNEITLTRYIDWMISTPFMLFVLCMVLGNEKNIPFTFKIFVIVLLLDLAMLLSGYLGETGKISKLSGLIAGFFFFGLMYFYIWYIFVAHGKNTFAVYLSYFIFLIVWSIYGIAYMMDDATKNIIYNILDLIAKAFVGIFFWMYFTKSVVF
jgi:bacteriorhodopsin